MLKESGSEYSLFEKMYNALFFSVLDYIHQLNMLSHVKYRNFNFTHIKKNLNKSKRTKVKRKWF